MGIFNSKTQGHPLEIPENKPVSNWDANDLRIWLQAYNLDDFVRIFESRRITSTQLLGYRSLQDIDTNFFSFPPNRRNALWKQIEKLKMRCPCLIQLPKKIKEDNSSKMLEAEQNVLHKLLRLKGFSTLSHKDQVEKARNLFIAEKMLSSYLCENRIGTSKIYDNLYQDQEDYNSEDSEKREFIEAEPTLSNDEQQVSNENDGEDKPSDIISEDTHYSLMEINEELNPHYKISQKFLKIKLVIVEIHQNNSERFFRHALSPIIEKFNLAPTFGIFHSAIIVGPFYLEFNDSGLCIPRKCASKAAILAADMSSDIVGPHVSIALDRLSTLICHWNAFVTYTSKKNNCQAFVDELCKALGFDITKEKHEASSLGHFLKELRATGRCDLKFVVSKELHERCPWIKEKYGKSIKFNTHKELDDFVNEVNEKTSHNYFQYTKQGQDDNALLKSFDRAFWLRHFHNTNDANFTPHNCPFNNPDTTGSFCSSWFTS